MHVLCVCGDILARAGPGLLLYRRIYFLFFNIFIEQMHASRCVLIVRSSIGLVWSRNELENKAKKKNITSIQFNSLNNFKTYRCKKGSIKSKLCIN
jgi:hypothetical protein